MKPSIIVPCLILLISGLFLAWQKASTSSLRGELDELRERREAAEAQFALHERGRMIFSDAPKPGARTAKSLLAHSRGELDPDAMFSAMAQGVGARDVLGNLKTLLPMANLSPEDFDRMIEKLQSDTGPGHYRDRIKDMLALLAPSGDPATSLGKLLEIEASPNAYAHLVRGWSSEDPEAALTWFCTQRDAGALDGRATYRSPEAEIFGDLLGSIAESDPAKALTLMLEMKSEVAGDEFDAAFQIAEGVGREMGGGADDALLKDLLEWNGNDKRASVLVGAAMKTATEGKGFDAVVEFAEHYLPNEFMRHQAIQSHLMDQHDQPLEDRARQLIGYLPEDDRSNAIGWLVSGDLGRRPERDALAWAEEQPRGLVRDHAWESVATHARQRGDFETAAERIALIDDKSMRSEEMESLARSWIRQDEAGARATLPAKLFQSVTDGE